MARAGPLPPHGVGSPALFPRPGMGTGTIAGKLFWGNESDMIWPFLNTTRLSQSECNLA